MSRMAAASAWGLEQWSNVEKYVQCIPKETMDGSFYRAVLSIHNKDYHVAKQVNGKLENLMFLRKPSIFLMSFWSKNEFWEVNF